MTPVPVRETLSGLVDASVVKRSVSERAPSTWGVKVTVILQEADGASVEPQVVLVMAKCVPVTMVTEAMLSVAPPEFVSWMTQGFSETLQEVSGEFCGELPKAAEVGLRETPGTNAPLVRK